MGAPERRTHVIRFTSADNSDTYVDIERIDVLAANSNGNSKDALDPATSQKQFIRLYWGDDATRSVYGPDDFSTERASTPDTIVTGPGDVNPTRIVKTVTVSNPANPSMQIIVNATTKFTAIEYGYGWQKAVSLFDNTDGNQVRKITPLRVTGYSHPSDYVDVACVTQFTAVENAYDYQKAITKLDNNYIINSFGAAGSDNLVRLDPFQNIINVNWGTSGHSHVGSWFSYGFAGWQEFPNFGDNTDIKLADGITPGPQVVIGTYVASTMALFEGMFPPLPNPNNPNFFPNEANAKFCQLCQFPLGPGPEPFGLYPFSNCYVWCTFEGAP